MKYCLNVLIFFLFAFNLLAQCDNWLNSEFKDDAENNHVIYRQALKSQNYDAAYESWEKVFQVAPAADGKRDVQYFDGVELLLHKFNAETDPGKKAQIGERILSIYDQVAECYKNGAIALKCDSGDCLKNTLGYIYGRKAYSMFYYLNSPYDNTLEAINMAIDAAKINNEYVIFDPAARITVYQFKNGYMSKEAAAKIFLQLNEIADHNILNNEALSAYFLQAKENMNATFAEIEDDIFDYQYFKEKFLPEFEEDPENPEVLIKIIAVLKQKNTPADDPFLVELESRYKKYALEENQRRKEEFAANNPGAAAKILYDEGKYNEAISKYYEAIKVEEDNEKKANYYFSIASIQFRKLSRYAEARNTAKEALKYRPNWGRPYMLIGDMYAKTARNCGDDWNQRLAILAAIDKYSYAKSVDPDVSSEASERISLYAKAMPDKEDAFMMKKKEGDAETVGCWIGETVRLRFRS